MAQKSTDLRSSTPQCVPDDPFQTGAGWVLATIAHRYRTERPEDLVDLLGFPIAVGATAYKLMGSSYQGGLPKVARLAHAAAPKATEGMTRGDLVGPLAEAAQSLGFAWNESDNEPVIPRLPVPGPRRTPESKSAGVTAR